MSLKTRYRNAIEKNKIINQNEFKITVDLLTELPVLLREYIIKCGYINKPNIQNQEIVWENTRHRTTEKSKYMKLDYYHFIELNKFERHVYINAKIMEIEENCINGIGGWNMRLFKIIQLINIKNTMEINASALVTFLSEFSIVPLLFLSKDIVFTNELHSSVTVEIKKNNMSVSGTFYFDANGMINRFETNDRYSSIDGKAYKKIKWIGIIENYKIINGIKIPGRFSASWNDNGSEFEYFHGDIKNIKINQ